MNLIHLSLTISLIILILAFTSFFYIRYKYSKWHSSLPIFGVFVAGLIAYFPINTEYNLFSNIASSMLDSAKLFFFESDYYDTIADAFYIIGSESLFVEIIFTILFILAPICTAVIIISCISDTITYLGLKLPTLESKYVFSSLNEMTISLAKSMKDNRMKGIYIFCNVSKQSRAQNPYYEEAKRNKFLVIEKQALAIPPSLSKEHTPFAKKRKTYYFAMSKNSSENLDLTLTLMELYKDNDNVKIYITSNEAEDEALLDNKTKSLSNNDSTSPKYFLRHINETQLMAYELLDKNPLYNAVTDSQKKVSMLILGCGYTGTEVLKNSIWCSRSYSYKFDATILDADIKRSEGIFNRFAPALDKNTYHITFHEENINAETDAVLNYVQSMNGIFNYIVISTNNDEINIKTALDLQSWYMRTNHSAIIAVSIKDKQKYDLLRKLETDSKKTNVQLFPFGCSLTLYTYQKIIESNLEKFAICINSIYNRTYSKFEGEECVISYKDAIDGWGRLTLQKRRSSMALGVFIRYILWMLGYELTEEINGEVLKISLDNCEKLSRLEHERWNAYQLIEGYYPWDFDKLMDFIKKFGINIVKDEEKRLHACITDWETLGKIDELLKSPYADHDRNFIRAIPDIVSGFNGEFGYHYGVHKTSSFTEDDK